MKKSYVIQWKSKVNGRAGKGTKLFDHEEGQRLVEELNVEYPQIEHELVENKLPPPAPEYAESRPQHTEPEHAEVESEETHEEHPVPVH